MVRKIITEQTIIDEGYKKIDKGLYMKKTGIGKKVWPRCPRCNRWYLKAINVNSSQSKLIAQCPHELEDSGEAYVKNQWTLPTRKLKIQVTK